MIPKLADPHKLLRADTDAGIDDADDYEADTLT